MAVYLECFGGIWKLSEQDFTQYCRHWMEGREPNLDCWTWKLKIKPSTLYYDSEGNLNSKTNNHRVVHVLQWTVEDFTREYKARMG